MTREGNLLWSCDVQDPLTVACTTPQQLTTIICSRGISRTREKLCLNMSGARGRASHPRILEYVVLPARTTIITQDLRDTIGYCTYCTGTDLPSEEKLSFTVTPVYGNNPRKQLSDLLFVLFSYHGQMQITLNTIT
jgi:hypothetical protein